MFNVLPVVLLLVALTVTSAAHDVYSFSLYANADVDGKCQAQASILGDEIQARFAASIPGFTPYDGSVGTRFLRSIERDLQINLCNRKYCSKPQNWDACLWNGCSCTCGGRRELVIMSGNSASMDARIVQTTKVMDSMLVARGKELGCVLGLEVKKVQG